MIANVEIGIHQASADPDRLNSETHPLIKRNSPQEVFSTLASKKRGNKMILLPRYLFTIPYRTGTFPAACRSLMTPAAMPSGTTAYRLNSSVNVPRPCVMLRRSVA